PAAGERLARPRLPDGDAFRLPPALPAELVGRRPDIQMMRHRVEAASHGIEAARAAFYPNIDLLAFVGFQALGFNQLLDNSSAMRSVGPAISLPIFDGGRRRSQLRRETAAYDAAVDDYNQSLVHGLQQVADQLSRLASNARETEDAGLSLAAAQRRADALQRAWRAGLTPLPAVLEARAQALEAQQAMVRLQAARRSDFAGLVLATGGELPAGAAQP
ncbi:MAG: TolC family protein, partial [Zoogloea sp.]|nr:TolC family protein [Zoogloea sp.]